MSQTPPPMPPNPYASHRPQLSPADEKLWAILIHIGGILFSFIPSLVGFLVLKERGPFIREHTAAALNFQITMAIASVVAALLWIVVLGTIISIAIWILVIVFSIIAALAANRGEYYTYPLSIHFVR